MTLQTLENGGKMLLLFGNNGYLILLSKCFGFLVGRKEKLCICAGFLVTLQTLKNEGKKLLLFGNHGYFTVKIFFELEGKTLHLCNFFVTMLILSNGREH